MKSSQLDIEILKFIRVLKEDVEVTSIDIHKDTDGKEFLELFYMEGDGKTNFYRRG